MLEYIIEAEQIKFRSLELIGPKVRISHSGRDGKRTALLDLENSSFFSNKGTFNKSLK